MKEVDSAALNESSARDGATGSDRGRQFRFIGGVSFLLVLTFVFFQHLYALALHAANSEMSSYILLVPWISAYLINIERRLLPRDYVSAPGFTLALLFGGVAAYVAGWLLPGAGVTVSDSDTLALKILSFVCLLLAGGFLFLGRKWMAAAAFPCAFLIFMVPLPDRMVEVLEMGSQLASAEAAALFFSISGTPVFRDGCVFQLPGTVIQVARECSGIQSSMALFLVGLLVSHLFLKSPWRRAVLVAVVIPLGILRNGFRILVISLLCIHIGPHMIHSIIHHRGGPLFFTLSLVPLSLLLWWLRKGDLGSRRAGIVKRVETK